MAEQQILNKQLLNMLQLIGLSDKISNQLAHTTVHSGKHDLPIIPENRDKIILKYMPIAKSQAYKYYISTGCAESHKIELDDVKQHAAQALIIATDNFLAKSGDFNVYQFTSYAKLWIKKYCLEYINVTKEDLSTGIRAAFEKRTGVYKFQRIDASYTSDSGDSYNPTDALLTDGIGADNNSHIVESLNIRKTFIDEILSSLPEDASAVVRMHFGLGCDAKNDRAIAKCLGMTIKNVSLLLTTSIQSLASADLTKSKKDSIPMDIDVMYDEYEHAKNNESQFTTASYVRYGADTETSNTLSKLGLTNEVLSMF